jgi:hypothetical protein
MTKTILRERFGRFLPCEFAVEMDDFSEFYRMWFLLESMKKVEAVADLLNALKPGAGQLENAQYIANLAESLSDQMYDLINERGYPSPVGDAPKITTEPVTEVEPEQAYSYVLEATDPLGAGVLFTLLEGPDWLTLNQDGLTATLSGTAPEGDGTYRVVVRVANEFALVDFQVFELALVTED